MEKQEQPAFLELRKFAAEIDASQSLVRTLIRQGKIPAVKIGGTLRIPSDAVDIFKQAALKNLAASTSD